jgi:hypothetical protein
MDGQKEKIDQFFIESRKLVAPSVSHESLLTHLAMVIPKSPAFLMYKYVRHVPDIR